MAAISFNRSPGDSALAVLAQKLVFACLIVGIMESETEELKALNINMKTPSTSCDTNDRRKRGNFI